MGLQGTSPPPEGRIKTNNCFEKRENKMIVNRKSRDKLLGVAALITFVIGSCNAFEFFLTGKNYLNQQTGIVEEVTHEMYNGRRNVMHYRTIIHLVGKSGAFYLTEKADEGGYIEVEKGETITLYKRWFFQRLYNYDFRSNFFYAEKNGKLEYNNLDQWKSTAFSNMCLFGGCALFLLIMYLDQVKNISISNWFQKRFLHKQRK